MSANKYTPMIVKWALGLLSVIIIGFATLAYAHLTEKIEASTAAIEKMDLKIDNLVDAVNNSVLADSLQGRDISALKKEIADVKEEINNTIRNRILLVVALVVMMVAAMVLQAGDAPDPDKYTVQFLIREGYSDSAIGEIMELPRITYREYRVVSLDGRYAARTTLTPDGCTNHTLYDYRGKKGR